MNRLGATRSSRQPDHLLQTPDSYVRAALPGMSRATAIVHAGPAIGAGFAGYTVEMEPEGSLGPCTSQRFLYVLAGSVQFTSGSENDELQPGGYAYVPSATRHSITANVPSRLAIIEKEYRPLQNHPEPACFVGNESSVLPNSLLGDSAVHVRSLLPDHASFDFAVNTLVFEPGASLPQVEVHVMEHGLLMLEGGGIYRLNDCWYPVSAGDFIWMAPFCPQWFGAIGKVPAKYLIYKDWNRHPFGA